MHRGVASFSAVVVLAAGCSPDAAVRWGQPRSLGGVGGGAGTRLALSHDGEPSLMHADAERVVTRGDVCPGTLSVAPDGLGGAFAAWWAPREDGSAALVVSRRRAGSDSVWDAPVVADARDRSSDGCNRAAPAIAADGARGYVHLAYYVDASEGAGVYAGHSMESGTYFHAPVVVVYGDRPGRTAIATNGDIVTIAYEDPNSARARIGLAISASAGHLFEHRLPVSPVSAVATDPAIAIEGRRVAVAWTAEAWDDDRERAGQRVVRVGELDGVVDTVTQGRRREADRGTHDR